ncbi:MAG: prepilin-type N-terminal cleavage/methylation domain-containing protein, partial [Fusobacteriaceae bacterium]
MLVRRKKKNSGFSLVELLLGIVLIGLLFGILNPVIVSSLKIFRASSEKSLGMSGKRIFETLSAYAGSALGGRILMIDTTSTLSNRDIDLNRIGAVGEKGNGIYIEVAILCPKNGVWKLVTMGHIFRFMETANQGKHMRYIPVTNFKGGKEEIISSDVGLGF